MFRCSAQYASRSVVNSCANSADSRPRYGNVVGDFRLNTRAWHRKSPRLPQLYRGAAIIASRTRWHSDETSSSSAEKSSGRSPLPAAMSSSCSTGVCQSRPSDTKCAASPVFVNSSTQSCSAFSFT